MADEYLRAFDMPQDAPAERVQLDNDDLLDTSAVSTVDPPSQEGPLDPESLKTYLQNLDPEDFGKFMP